MLRVAPARERGLKFVILTIKILDCLSRSREGAWIEMDVRKVSALTAGVAPARERGLKSYFNASRLHQRKVAPARERGLKFGSHSSMMNINPSLPRGSVD